MVNKLYPVKYAKQWFQDVLLYSHFSKLEKKDLTIRVHAKSNLYDQGIEYSITNQIWSDVIKMSVKQPWISSLIERVTSCRADKYSRQCQHCAQSLLDSRFNF